MGHSDRLVIADGNFPVESMGKNAITIAATDTVYRKFWKLFSKFSRWILM